VLFCEAAGQQIPAGPDWAGRHHIMSRDVARVLRLARRCSAAEAHFRHKSVPIYYKT
jgi:hypothetical protein